MKKIFPKVSENSFYTIEIVVNYYFHIPTALNVLDKHPFSELFYMFSSDLVEKAPTQTVSILIKHGQKLDPLKVINALILPNPSEKLVSAKN